MKKVLFLLILFCLQKALHAQQPYIYTIKADSVKITNTCDTAELIIENHTQNIPGFLFNKGRGRTEFRRPLLKLSDSLYLVGIDSLKLPNAWLQGGNSFGTIGKFGTNDNNPVDFYSNNTFRGRLSTSGNLLWGTTVEDGRWKMEVESGSVGAIKAKNRFDVFARDSTQSASVVISNGNFGPCLTLGVAGGYYAWSPYAVPTDAVISTRNYLRLILESKMVIIRTNTLIGTSVDDGNKLQVNGTGKFTDTLKLPNIIAKADTVGYKPMAIDANGNVFKMAGWNSQKNFANADLTLTGDRNHNGAFKYLNLNDFGGFDFKSSSTDGNYVHEMKMDTMYGIRFSTLSNYDRVQSSFLTMNDQGLNYQFDNATTIPQKSILKMKSNGFQISNNESTGASTSISTSNNHESGSNDLTISDRGADLKLLNVHGEGLKYAAINLCQGDSIVIAQGANYPSAQMNTKYVQYTDRFIFKNAYTGTLDFRLYGLPASSTTDNTLVIDNNGQVKIRTQAPSRKSATVTGASYTVPADIEVVFVNYTAGQATITLPTGTLDREITIKNLHTTNTVIISGLDTSESNSIATRGALTVKYTGSAWVGISKY